MESSGNNHGFLDGNERIAFTAADVLPPAQWLLHRGRSPSGLRVHCRLDGRARIPVRPNPRLDPSAHKAPCGNWFFLSFNLLAFHRTSSSSTRCSRRL
jgi:hypothetical protein